MGVHSVLPCRGLRLAFFFFQRASLTFAFVGYATTAHFFLSFFVFRLAYNVP